jgi:hypothetical protein
VQVRQRNAEPLEDTGQPGDANAVVSYFQLCQCSLYMTSSSFFLTSNGSPDLRRFELGPRAAGEAQGPAAAARGAAVTVQQLSPFSLISSNLPGAARALVCVSPPVGRVLQEFSEGHWSEERL